MIKKFQKIIHYNFRYQLTLVLLAISIFPFLLMQGVTHFVTSAAMKDKVYSLINDQVSKNEDNINLLLKNYITLAGTLSSDYNLIELLHSLDAEPKLNTIAATTQAIKEKLYLSSFTINEVVSIAILTGEGAVIPYHKSNLKFDISTYSSMHHAVKQTFKVVGGLLSPHTNNKNAPYIYVARRISDLNTFKHLGTLVICINPSVIQKACFNEESTQYSSSFVLTSSGQVVSSLDSNNISHYMDPEAFLEKNPHLLMYNRPLTYLDWELIHIIDEKVVTKELVSVSYINFILTISIAIILIFIIFWVCKTFTKPIPALLTAMDEVEKGNLDIIVPTKSTNEFLEIEKNFNYMVSCIKDLLSQNTRQFEELLSLTEQKKNAEIRALEAQINPHFLFNTLDSINWMAIEKEEYEISLMLRNLALILRYTISNSNEMVPLKSEVDWLHQYLYLQQQRFVNVFEYTIHINESLYFYKIHKLLLQPIIENALLHGFEGITQGGKLTISFELTKEQCIVISIQDNGRGISEDKLLYIKNLLNSDSIMREGNSIGISNVIFRLYSYYGDKGNLQVNTNTSGTLFKITLPMLT